MGRLDGKVAVVTGASRGIGADIARLFASEGGRVVCAARTLEEGQHPLAGSLTTTVAAIRGTGGEAHAVAANIAEPAECERLIHEAGAALVREPVPSELLRAYGRECAGLRARFDALLALDRGHEGWFLVGPDETVRPWPPEGVDLASWAIEPPPATDVLHDGDVVELGNRPLRVVHFCETGLP